MALNSKLTKRFTGYIYISTVLTHNLKKQNKQKTQTNKKQNKTKQNKNKRTNKQTNKQNLPGQLKFQWQCWVSYFEQSIILFDI